jgi:hypothetical protein
MQVMDKFPPNTIPNQTAPEELRSDNAYSMEKAVRDPKVVTKLEAAAANWPRGFRSAFLQLSGLIGQALAGYAPAARSRIGFPAMMAAGLRDPGILELLMRAGQIGKEAKPSAKGEEETSQEEDSLFGPIDPANMQKFLIQEAERRVRQQNTPFGNTISTLLGPNALQWLAAESVEGHAKIQAHEFSRTGWADLSSIDNQIRIEQELLDIGKRNEEDAKIVVALCWSIAALASFVEPWVFLSEADAHLSSDREGQFTVSYGLATRTLVGFDTDSMRSVVRLLHDALEEPEFMACDLMWIASGLAKVRTVSSGHTGPVEPVREEFSIFLSHRGQDAKKLLAENVMKQGEQHAIFLDCLTLPRGLINRKFVFESLAKSKRIFIVETPNYEKSAWCRKERWVAESMQRLDLASVQRVPLAEATSAIDVSGIPARPRQPARAFHYPIAPRILKDADYWARKPNKHSLAQRGMPTDFLTKIEGFIAGAACATDAAKHVAKLMKALLATRPKLDPIDPWSAALQYAVAAFGLGLFARSEMDVRRGIDQMNGALGAMISEKVFDDAIFQKNPSGYLTLICAAVLLDLTGFTLKEDSEAEIQAAVRDVATLKSGTLLLDVRVPGAKRNLHLKLLLALVTNNIGSVGIVQSAADMVHELEVGGRSLSVLPCVTLHPGMEALFPALAR